MALTRKILMTPTDIFTHPVHLGLGATAEVEPRFIGEMRRSSSRLAPARSTGRDDGHAAGAGEDGWAQELVTAPEDVHQRPHAAVR
jgi:hypothetical protein